MATRAAILVAIIGAFLGLSCGKKAAPAASAPADLARVILTIEASGDPNIDVERDLKEVDRLAKMLATRMVSDEPWEQLRAMADYLHRNFVVQYSLEQPRLHTLLTKHQGNCAAISLLYVVLGQRLEMPIRLALAPGHAFVFWDAPGERIYWEATGRGHAFALEKQPSLKPVTELSLAQTPVLAWTGLSRSLCDQGRNEDVLRATQETAKLDPACRADAAWWFYRGDAYTQLGRYDQAIAAYQEADKAASSSDAQLSIAKVERRRGRYEMAAGLIHKYLQTHPDDAKAMLAQGELLLALYDYDAALRAFDQCTQAWPEEFNGWAYRGNVQRCLHQTTAAIQSARRAEALHPEWAEGWALEAMCHLSQHDFEDAVADATRAIEHGKRSIDYYTRGSAYLCLRKYDAALADAEQAMKLDPGNTNCHLLGACVLVEFGRAEEAQAELLQGIQPEWTPRAFWYRSDYWWRLHKYSRSLGDFQMYLLTTGVMAPLDAARACYFRFESAVVKSILFSPANP